MRLLCDQNVAAKYVGTFERADGITVTTVAEALAPEASDEDVVRFAEQANWVVFTTDDDFFEHADVCGVLIYSQLTDPSPGNVLDAVEAIDDAYEANSDITETIPGDWV